MVRTHTFGGVLHFVVRQSNDTLALLPAWMTEPAAAALQLVERPVLSLTTLRAIRILLGAIILPESILSEGDRVDRFSDREPSGSLCRHEPDPKGRGSDAVTSPAATRQTSAAGDPQQVVRERERGDRR